MLFFAEFLRKGAFVLSPLGGAPFEFADLMVTGETEEENNMENRLDQDEAD